MAMELDDFLRTIVSEVRHLGKMKRHCESQ